MSKSLIFVKLGFGFGEGEGPEQKTSGGRGKGARREEDHEDQERHRFSFPWRPGGSEQKFPHDDEGEKKRKGFWRAQQRDGEQELHNLCARGIL